MNRSADSPADGMQVGRTKRLPMQSDDHDTFKVSDSTRFEVTKLMTNRNEQEQSLRGQQLMRTSRTYMSLKVPRAIEVLADRVSQVRMKNDPSLMKLDEVVSTNINSVK